MRIDAKHYIDYRWGMNWAAALLILMFATAQTASAYAPQTLAELCQPGFQKTYEPDLEELLTRFGSLELRRANPEGFIADLNRYISKTEAGAELLKCREGLPYRVSFIEAGAMGVDREYDRQGNLAGLNMSFDLSLSALTALFTYAHELRHVCQTGRSQELWKTYYAKFNSLTPREKLYYSNRQDAKQKGIPNAEFETLRGKILRANLTGEVDAFHFQLQEFTKTALKSPALCRFRQAQGYVAMERDLRDGIFAQVNLNFYVASYDPNDSEIFVVDSPLRTYPDRSLNTTFSMRTLHPEIVNFLLENSIPYRLP